MATQKVSRKIYYPLFAACGVVALSLGVVTGALAAPRNLCEIVFLPSYEERVAALRERITMGKALSVNEALEFDRLVATDKGTGFLELAMQTSPSLVPARFFAMTGYTLREESWLKRAHALQMFERSPPDAIEQQFLEGIGRLDPHLGVRKVAQNILALVRGVPPVAEVATPQSFSAASDELSGADLLKEYDNTLSGMNEHEVRELALKLQDRLMRHKVPYRLASGTSGVVEILPHPHTPLGLFVTRVHRVFPGVTVRVDPAAAARGELHDFEVNDEGLSLPLAVARDFTIDANRQLPAWIAALSFHYDASAGLPSAFVGFVRAGKKISLSSLFTGLYDLRDVWNSLKSLEDQGYQDTPKELRSVRLMRAMLAQKKLRLLKVKAVFAELARAQFSESTPKTGDAKVSMTEYSSELSLNFVADFVGDTPQSPGPSLVRRWVRAQVFRGDALIYEAPLVHIERANDRARFKRLREQMDRVQSEIVDLEVLLSTYAEALNMYADAVENEADAETKARILAVMHFPEDPREMKEFR